MSLYTLKATARNGRWLAALLVTVCWPAFGQVLWSDEFDSGTSLDEATWSYDLGAGGWGNAELQTYTNEPGNVRIEDGHLVITAREVATAGGGRRFTSARVRTEDKLIFRYGTIEARIRMPNLADGLWPAFWTLGNNFSEVGWPFCGELDILEMGSGAAIAAGQTNRRVGSAAHWDDNGTRRYYSGSLLADVNLDDDFHVYRMEWTPELVTTYIDDRRIWAIDITSPSCRNCSEFHQAHFMILNMAVGGTYTQQFSSTDISAPLPAEMWVDYVRILDNGFTEVAGTALADGPQLDASYSGAWYNPAQSGHGFTLQFGNSNDGFPQAVAYWFTYDTDGQPVTMVGTGVPDGMSLELELISPYGMKYGEFDPETTVEAPGGTARFDFSNPDNATFSYSPSEFSVSTWGHTPIESLPLTRLFAVPVSNQGDQASAQ